jgi:hypothetical protein
MVGSAFTVDPDVRFRSSVQFLDTKQFVFDIASGTVADLGALAGMAGNDASQSSAAGYEPAARTVVQAMDRAAQAMAAISGRLLTISQ